jgi:hypothetical protein
MQPTFRQAAPRAGKAKELASAWKASFDEKAVERLQAKKTTFHSKGSALSASSRIIAILYWR